MNNYFINKTQTSNLKPYKSPNFMNINEIISTFDNHISIERIKEYISDAFNNNLNVEKSSTSNSIPATILKQSIGIHLPFLANSISYTIKSGEFPDKLKKSGSYSFR